jgi:hypothetical protein
VVDGMMPLHCLAVGNCAQLTLLLLLLLRIHL